MFDPNFGEYNIPGGFDSWDELVACVFWDYQLLFRFAGAGAPARFSIESAGG
jgi:hypothetical protein